ncbi:golgin candidate 1-like [Andrographis paniculata]|uniref:golgin candidate 1-like n=1 Tax=Andrographis paniculata TaxID=175694 RepID=UPI0021E7CF32|nr:golgin candidate 1-like [Andrographis paniculata]
MASWLKVAEDIFEVVDRRAKLVVGEKPDELRVPPPESNGLGSQTKKGRSRKKKNSANQGSSSNKEQDIPKTSQPQTQPDGNVPMPSNENIESKPGVPSSDVDNGEGEQKKTDRVGSVTEDSLSGTISHDEEVKEVSLHPDTDGSANVEGAPSTINGDLQSGESADGPVENQSHSTKDIGAVNGDFPFDSTQNINSSNHDVMSEDTGSQKNTDLPKPQGLHEDTPTKNDTQLKDSEIVIEPDTRIKQHVEQNVVTPAEDVQEQLEEAHGLLKTTVSSGQSKEARLARVCAGLSSRLQEYKSENAQLEELLLAERELTKSYEASIKKLQKDLFLSKEDVSRVEANMAEALSAKNAEIESLAGSVDALKKQVALSEENLSSLQENMESVIRNRELTETRMMQALREELAAAERRAEEEHAAHNATKLAAREREVELEQRAIEASAALARIQRTADDRASKAAELEQKVALLEVECSSLNQELQDMEARVRRGQKKSPEDGNQAIQVQAMQEEVERAREGQRDAENKLSSMEAEVQKMRVELSAMKRDAEHYSRQEHMELEKRYRELTDLLYFKQTQLETMASEKAAAEFQLEKELKRLQEVQLEAERNKVSRRGSTSWEEDTDVKALEPLPLHQRQVAGASLQLQLQLQKAVKLVDKGAARATRFLWRYPTARIILLFYLVFVHLFLMYLLHRLQEQADTYTSKEIAEKMGLSNKTLP